MVTEKVTVGTIIVKTPFSREGRLNQGNPAKLGKPSGNLGMSIFGRAIGIGGGKGIAGIVGTGMDIDGVLNGKGIFGKEKLGNVGNAGRSGMSISFGRGGGKGKEGIAGIGRFIFGSLLAKARRTASILGKPKLGNVGNAGRSGMSISFGRGGGKGMPREIGIGKRDTVENTILVPYFPSVLITSVVMLYGPKHQ